MENLSNELKVLRNIDEKGEKTFTELINDKNLDLSRNTINKYLNLYRKILDIE